jgi:hypothetical protein
MLVLPATVLGFTAVAMVVPVATASIRDQGPHDLSEMLCADTTAAGNNGSACAGLTRPSATTDSDGQGGTRAAPTSPPLPPPRISARPPSRCSMRYRNGSRL